ncbi:MULTISPECIES: dihydrodipicolinate synthase family protein [Thalassospira]|jgi:4-hydroxy-tetrahydrodipicolinate synthase|uniref:Dihydrodipicolinate synthase family protein n=2 Tax=Thalassospira TaxID=168934 RepID=A0ABR5Y5X0_9PROT|nr:MULTISPECIES: dihydrodipicolinate synthase family protein [Thalassospira]MBL4843282.1 dihydrodipicolinate synthase family protein [Thalassospira sp.]MBR9781467.1 dihydrodipicolinate synthase family protein [Rhodospirillales bacterium]KEO58130.1 dihydrodipicolinate synthase [Thalassospira permensis NBRC 106175]KZD05972.1 dihydrodipicolinate synthase family protein [Thalassospira xiamenensis]KZD07499.1 dihydrodipicolinate synthase family protein [Thalassospira xiamenensis]|tara:strand:+ start:1503 stop:2399 length:897 start_codon:yes stop_codon:yes gene_type:complete
MQVNWTGVFPAVATQMNEDGSIDFDMTAHQIEALIKAGVDGLVMLGSVGENATLEPEEKIAVLKLAVEVTNGRIPVLSGVAENSTQAAIRYVQKCEELGADGLMLLPGMIYTADPRENIEHFRSVAAKTKLPIMIYNNPGAYRIDIKPEEFNQLADVKNLVAIKESSGDPRRITDIYNACGDRFVLFCGMDDLVMETQVLGAVGWISGFTDAFPQESVALWKLLSEGKYKEALEIYRWFTPVLHMDVHAKLVQYIKLAQEMTGVGKAHVRAPRLPLVGEEMERIRATIQKAIDTRPKL